MSAVTDALAEGITTLLGESGKTFAFGGVDFTAATDTKPAGDPLGRNYRHGGEFETVLMVNPSATAFASGLPSKGDTLTQASDSRRFKVANVQHDAGDQVAFITATKLNN